MEANTTLKSTVTVTLNASDARLMAEALFEMKRDWADAADSARIAGDTDGANYEFMLKCAAERVAGALHEAGWKQS